MNNPLVSIIVPSYNHANYVEECILSVINQTYNNIQLIVIDDGSKDNSVEILKRLQLKHDFILDTQTNMGLSKTLNKGIKNHAKGEFICCLASDDYMMPDKIKLQVDYLQNNLNMGFVFGKAYKVNDSGEIFGKLPEVKLPNLNFSSLLLSNYIPALTGMINRKALDEVGLYDETSYIEDWDMWLRIADKYSFGFVDEYVAYYRLHNSNISGNYGKMIASKKYIVNKWRGHKCYKRAYDAVLLEEIDIASILQKREAISLIIKEIRLIRRMRYLKAIVKLFFKHKI
ncbi:glycosyltransferase family 2 protein [Mucilaginibacter psychrotolerans]|uniref:Glycosyltransferase n=1 Tax=Mucilaginibacter psychrotolerans TaxID=1524096 RepID=A0A4Y8S8U6_9SPHI|nr:glycosyltransferase [Mucilaginibacter psychrotolerans]TFF35523.1 glycosyltransferase [Mucilaginibacter psychrotolerans]